MYPFVYKTLDDPMAYGWTVLFTALSFTMVRGWIAALNGAVPRADRTTGWHVVAGSFALAGLVAGLLGLAALALHHWSRLT